MSGLAEVLGDHRLCWRRVTLAVCACGKWARPDDRGGSLNAPVRREHDAHLAAVVAAWVLDDAQVERAVEAMVDVQDEFREETTFHDHARAALAATADAGVGRGEGTC